MQFWDTIVNTAMVGTDKRQVAPDEVPDILQDVYQLTIQNDQADREEKFLQLAALTFNFRQSGFVPVNKNVTMQTAPAEEKKYCSEDASRALKEILASGNNPLLQFWCRLCEQNGLIVQPQSIPSLLNLALTQKNLRNTFYAVCGKRGEWLSDLNPDWKRGRTTIADDAFSTATTEERKILLSEKRSTEPSTAREWLIATWDQEDANTRAALLEMLITNIGPDDIQFLEQMSNDKSKKVKDVALRLLKQIPGSGILNSYENLLSRSVFISTEKTMMGLMSKKVLTIKLPPDIDEAIFKSGIDKLSSDKKISDEEYVISQLVASVPPAFWERHFNMQPGELIILLQKDTPGQKLLPAIAEAVIKFGDQNWALNFMQYCDQLFTGLIALLPVVQQEAYSIKFFEKAPAEIIQYAAERETEWSIDLTRAILHFTSKNIYQYHNGFYAKHIMLIPFAIHEDLEKFKPKEDYLSANWLNIAGNISNLLSLKKNTINAFK